MQKKFWVNKFCVRELIAVFMTSCHNSGDCEVPSLRCIPQVQKCWARR
jgi:hypothetical protein